MTEVIYCPDCKPVFNRRKVQINAHMECSESNYSGTGEDLYACPDCGHAFFVSYKVDKINRAEDFEDKEEIARLAEEKKEFTALSMIKWLLQEIKPDEVPGEATLKNLDKMRQRLREMGEIE